MTIKWLSPVAADANVVHEPQLPWFFTEVTAPSSTQFLYPPVPTFPSTGGASDFFYEIICFSKSPCPDLR